MKTSKTPKLPKTTTSPLDYQYEIFEYDDKTVLEKVRISSVVEDFMAFLGVFICIFHFCVLTQKPLRCDFIYFSILIICICDFSCFSGTLISSFIEFLAKTDCFTLYTKTQLKIQVGTIIAHSVARNVSSVIIILISVLKIFSGKLKVKFAILINLSVLAMFIFYHSWSNWSYKLENYQMSGCESDPDTLFDSNELFMKPKLLKTQKFYNNCITIVLTCLLFISFVVLFIKLRVVVRTKNGEDDTFILLLLLSLSFLISELLDVMVILFGKFALKPYYNIQTYYIRFQVIARTIITINTVTHCFICLLTSSEYFDGARKLLRWKKKPTTQKPDVPSVSTIRTVDATNTEF